jgi:2-succinyl-6-hydroxy-2,4-cyclohexadiene-1-carboxylate synthase
VRIVLIHGFTQTAASWDAVARDLLADLAVVRVELPGHGAEGSARRDFVDAARAIGAVGGEGVYVGYSMGGRLALQLARLEPTLVRGLVLLGASPGIADAAERAARRDADELLAAAIKRDGVRTFLTGWLAQPMFATVPSDAPGIRDRSKNTAAGLASALRTLGPGTQPYLGDELSELTMPVLLTAGEFDAKYRAIAEDMATRIGANASTATIPHAGHAALLEQPEAFARVVADFARRLAG